MYCETLLPSRKCSYRCIKIKRHECKVVRRFQRELVWYLKSLYGRCLDYIKNFALWWKGVLQKWNNCHFYKLNKYNLDMTLYNLAEIYRSFWWTSVILHQIARQHVAEYSYNAVIVAALRSQDSYRLRVERITYITKQTNKLRGFSPQANYTDRATAACRRS
jgi:hypothetical protein